MSIDEDVSRILSEYREVAAAWVFGSVARGDARPGSDVDLAVLLTDPRATAADCHRRLRDIAARIESAADRAVDLVALGLRDPIIAHRALSEGRLILDRDRSRRVAFEVAVLSRYLDWAPAYESAARRSLEVNRAWARRQA